MAAEYVNDLIHEKSPYLQQHAHNPVAWLPWGEKAFERSRLQDKPIFLSIGYSTCHWCHVMAHESFEDPAVAEILNRDFVPVKIDREERPDVDRVYMLFVQASTGSGGWPMSVWLTPELRPFFGGTYYPPDNKYGRPGFRSLLIQLARAWRDDRARILQSSIDVLEQLRALSGKENGGGGAEVFAHRHIDSALMQFRRNYDRVYGGWGQAPKFPRPATLIFLHRCSIDRDVDGSTREEAMEMSAHTLRTMAAGGMHDHLGGGFHRYSVDERWFVSHFEKMLYDQAQLAIAYLEAFRISGDTGFRAVADDIFRYVLHDLCSPDGAFYSAEDADSPDPENPSHNSEGAFYLWRQAEILHLLGNQESVRFCRAYGVEPHGNVHADPHGEFHGRNILFVSRPEADDQASLQPSRATLRAARARRPRPHLDRKVLTSWNALMISALAQGDSYHRAAAARAASFLLQHMYDAKTGVLLRRYCDGEAAITGFADDYAFLAQALLDLFEAVGEPSYLITALDLVRRGLTAFEDPAGGFYSTAEGAPDVLLRIKDEYDGAEPSANAVAIDVLLRTAHLTGDAALNDRANRSIKWLSARIEGHGTAAPQALASAMRFLHPPEQTVIRSATRDDFALALWEEHRAAFNPYRAVLLLDDNAAEQLTPVAPFLSTLRREGRYTVYQCSNFTCQLPEVIN